MEGMMSSPSIRIVEHIKNRLHEPVELIEHYREKMCLSRKSYRTLNKNIVMGLIAKSVSQYERKAKRKGFMCFYWVAMSILFF